MLALVVQLSVRVCLPQVMFGLDKPKSYALRLKYKANFTDWVIIKES